MRCLEIEGCANKDVLFICPAGARWARRLNLICQINRCWTILRVLLKPFFDEAGAPIRQSGRPSIVAQYQVSIQHIKIRIAGRPRSMFIDEIAQLMGRPVNQAATEFYRRDWLDRHPTTQASSLPTVHGVAVIFDDLLWNGEGDGDGDGDGG